MIGSGSESPSNHHLNTELEIQQPDIKAMSLTEIQIPYCK